MAEESEKTVFNERVLAKLLEAAYVVQEHNRTQQPTPDPERPESAPNAADTWEEPGSAPPVPLRAFESEQPSVAEPARLHSDPDPDPRLDLRRPAVASDPASAPVSQDDFATALAQIVETQRQMRERRQELANPMEFIVERVRQITNAGGVALGILEGENIRYRATSGLMTPSVAEIPKEKALCSVCLQSGQVVRGDVDSSQQFDKAECRSRGIEAVIAVPVFHDGAASGGLELYYATKQAFTEQDVHTAQLMAGLVTEALSREEEATLRKSLAGERALMLEALEKLQPNLAALVDVSAGKSPAGKTGAAAAPSKAAIVCGKCGHELLDEEQFCGKCGAPRGGSYEPPSMQSKVASMWHMQEALKKQAGLPANGDGALPEPAQGFDDAEFEKMLAASLEKEMPELFQPMEARAERMWPETPQVPALSEMEAASVDEDLEATAEHKPKDTEDNEDEIEDDSHAVTALAKAPRNPDWSSAASAREFLEQLAADRSSGLARFWHARRGDFYLALAVILVAVVIRWGIWSNHAVSATGTPTTAGAQHRKGAPDADLSWFDRALVKMGLAEAPEPVEYKGNPQTQVWVDLHTALYYCPGTDLYGKTPKGKFTTQRDAQLDQFEPAYRKACD